MRRRGDAVWDQTVGIIFIAAVALVLLIWWFRAQYAYMGQNDIEACRLSIQGYAKSFMEVKLIGTDIHLVEPDCKRRVITFTEDSVELNGKTTKFYDPDKEKSRDSYRELTPGIVNSVAASEMATCWHEFLEGKSYWTNGVDWGNDDTACFVCGEIRFASDAPDFAPEPLVAFLETNESRPYPVVTPKNSVTGEQTRPTYLEYLYFEDRICDNSGSSHYPLTGSLVPSQGVKWYAEGSATCEQQFYEKVLTGQPVKGVGPTAPEWDPPMRDLQLSKDRSYMVLFFQLGEDKGKDKETGKPTGATYAPMIIPSERFVPGLCQQYLG